jgi:hypothetical protein
MKAKDLKPNDIFILLIDNFYKLHVYQKRDEKNPKKIIAFEISFDRYRGHQYSVGVQITLNENDKVMAPVAI